jgi:glycosyltransferase involved in cell wall biosynthesis
MKISTTSDRWDRPVDFGRTIMSCRAGYGSGGLGLHFAQIGDDLRERDLLSRYYTGAATPDAPPVGVVLTDPTFAWLARWTPLRFSRAWLNYLNAHRHDLAVARALSDTADTFIGFNSQSQRSFAAARSRGFRHMALIAATSHVRNVQRKHAALLQKYPIDSSWLHETQIRKTIAEYAEADTIIVGSEYTRQSMLAEGVAGEKLRKFRYYAHRRFTRDADHASFDERRFRIVYCGAVTPMKGIPVLIEAFSRFQRPGAELVIVGGTGSRSMRKYMQAVMQRDPRIKLAPGDPLPALQQARVYVHPSFDDGFGYAPVEAMACGVPVIVTEDTGMKERVREGVNGFIVPTGEWEPILQRLEYLDRHPLGVDLACLATTT